MKKIMCLLTMLMLMSVGVLATNGNDAATNHEPTMAQQQDQDMDQTKAEGEQPDATMKQKSKWFNWGTEERSGQQNRVSEAVGQAWERIRNQFREWFKFGQEEEPATEPEATP